MKYYRIEKVNSLHKIPDDDDGIGSGGGGG
jgi:hypothetical protein